MSHSTSSTPLPDVAMALARLEAMKGLPSLGTDEVMTMVLMGWSTLMKRMLASSVLEALSTDCIMRSIDLAVRPLEAGAKGMATTSRGWGSGR